MRMLLSILLAVGGGVLLMTMLTSEENGTAPDLRRGKDGGNPKVVKPPSNDPVQLQGAHGTDVFAPRSGKAIIDGEEVTYGSLLMWCRRFEAQSEERFEVEDVRIVANEKPETKADLERHLVIPRDTRPARIGTLLLDAMKGKKLAGVHAQGALFEGGRNLETARKILLKNGVVVYVVDPEDPTRTGEIHTETLELELEAGEVLRGVTEDAVTVTTAEGVLKGVGFSYDPRSGVFRIERTITGELTDLTLLGRRGPAATFQAGGPLVYEPNDARDDQVSLRPAGSFRLAKDVIVRQGEYEIRGQKMHLRTRSGRGQVEGFVVEDAVSATTPEGTFTGERITWTDEGDEGAKLLLEGAPVVATLTGAARAMPGIGANGDLDVSTDGTIVFTGLDRPEGEERTIDIGPEVVLRGSDDARIDAKMVRIKLLHVARNSARADAPATRLYPVKIRLENDVNGKGPTGSFSCRELEYTRTYTGTRALDRIEMLGKSELVYLTPAKPGAALTPTPTGKPGIGGLLAGRGPLHIEATERLELRLDPMRIEPTRANARGSVRVRRFSEADPDDEQGRLQAEVVELTLVETFAPDLDAPVIRFAGKRRVRRVAALSDVHVLIKDRLRGDGDVLQWHDDSGDLHLERNVPGKPAIVVVTDDDGREQTLHAPVVTYSRPGRSIHAKGGVTGHVRVPPISYGRGRVGDPVATDVTAQTITAWMRGDRSQPAGNGGSTSASGDITELLAVGTVVVSQGAGTGVKCDQLRVDLVREETIIRGSPARIDLIHVEGAERHPEWVESPIIAVTDGTALLTGPVQARMHARKKDLAMNVGSKKPAANDALLPIDITAGQDLFISEDRIQARGGTTVKQGDPQVDGFHLKGERILLSLVRTGTPTSPGGGTRRRLQGLDVSRALITGDVTFTSPDMAAEGDVIDFSNREKVIMLYRYRGNGPATLTWRGDRQLPRPRFDLELSDPDNPRIISALAPPSREGR